MSYYSPTKYVPFKKRIRGAFMGTLALGAAMLTEELVSSHFNQNHPTPQSGYNPLTDAATLSFLIGSMIFLCGIVVLSQVWVLGEVIIDEKRKTIRVLIRKFDTIIDKGEYDIDDKLKVKLSTKRGHGKSPINSILIKYEKKRIFSQSNSNFAGAPNWSSNSFVHIRDEVEYIKKTNFSIPYKG